MRFFRDIHHDVRFALRSLRRQPGLVVTASLSAALGIGVCTVVFGIVNLALFQQLPVQEPERLMAIEGRVANHTGLSTISRIEIRSLLATNSWESITHHLPFIAGSLGPSGNVKPAWGALVAGNYFDVVKPDFSLGQGFVDGEDDVEGAAPKVVLSHSVWRDRYGSDPSLLGQDIIVNGRPMSLAGVTAPLFQGTTAGLVIDYYLPFSQLQELAAMTTTEKLEISDELTLFMAIGRLRPGVEPAQADAELDIVRAGLLAQYPDRQPNRRFYLEPAGRLSQSIAESVRPLFLLLLAMAVLVLLTACANVANLLLAKAAVRRTELSTRLALGAGRIRLVRQLLTESVLLASAGGLLGFFLATWTGGLGGRITLPVAIPIDLTLPTDYRTLLTAIALCFVSALLFGLIPALRSTKTGVFDGLRSNMGASSTGFRRFGLRNGLAMAQIAMSTALLVCSLMFVRSFGIISDSLIGGIKTEGISVIGFDPVMSGYDATTGRELFERILREANATPGVLSAAITDALPSFGQGNSFAAEPIAEGSKGESAHVVSITPGFLEMLGIRVVDGEPFRLNSSNEASLIVDERLAKSLFPNSSAVGATVFDRQGNTFQIVGVAKNVSASPTLGLAQQMKYAYRPLLDSYTPAGRGSFIGLNLVVKLSQTAPPAILISQRALTGLDPNLVVSEPKTLQGFIDDALLFGKLPAMLFGVCGLMGLVIASIGIYGMISFAVAQRFKEIGIRRALGEHSTQVVRRIVAHAASVSGMGLGLGLGAGYALARLAESFVVGVKITDLVTYVVVAAIIMTVALAAAAVPAMRAASINPSDALRSE